LQPLKKSSVSSGHPLTTTEVVELQVAAEETLTVTKILVAMVAMDVLILSLIMTTTDDRMAIRFVLIIPVSLMKREKTKCLLNIFYFLCSSELSNLFQAISTS
jgi:cytochrome c oxidase subunit IV